MAVGVAKLQKNRQLVVGSLYRPPRHSVAALQADFADLEFQLQRIMVDYPKVPFVICGDMNCDMLKSPNFPARRHIDEILTDYSLHQVLTAHTYTSGSLLDICFVKYREFSRACSVRHCHFSPHKFVNLLVNVLKQRLHPTVIQSRSFKRIDVDALNGGLILTDWDEILGSTSVSDKSMSFKIFVHLSWTATPL